MVATYGGNQNIPMINGHTQHPQCGDFIAQVQCMRIFTTVDGGIYMGRVCCLAFSLCAGLGSKERVAKVSLAFSQLYEKKLCVQNYRRPGLPSRLGTTVSRCTNIHFPSTSLPSPPVLISLLAATITLLTDVFGQTETYKLKIAMDTHNLNQLYCWHIFSCGSLIHCVVHAEEAKSS